MKLLFSSALLFTAFSLYSSSTYIGGAHANATAAREISMEQRVKLVEVVNAISLYINSSDHDVPSAIRKVGEILKERAPIDAPYYYTQRGTPRSFIEWVETEVIVSKQDLQRAEETRHEICQKMHVRWKNVLKLLYQHADWFEMNVVRKTDLVSENGSSLNQMPSDPKTNREKPNMSGGKSYLLFRISKRGIVGGLFTIGLAWFLWNRYQKQDEKAK